MSRLEALLKANKKKTEKRKMGNRKKVWSKRDLKRATITIGD